MKNATSKNNVIQLKIAIAIVTMVKLQNIVLGVLSI